MKPIICITGGAQGLGRELVARFHLDYRIIILDLNQNLLAAVAKKFDCDYQICDVSDYISVKKSIDYINKKYHQIDILINCAGLYIDGEIGNNDPESIKKVVNVNVLGPMNLCKYVVPIMKRHKTGLIVNINSTASLHPKAYNSVYHSSKWGEFGFTESLQLELAPFGIKVTSVCPGLMKTKFTDGTNTDMSRAMEIDQVVKTIEFILSFEKNITIPQIVIKHL
jgi:short-subunit dehydrogenase